MTPKEKAIDLVRDMEFEIPYVHDPTEPQGDDIAKRCTLILVNEMLNNFLSNRTTEYGRERYHFWQQVKQEIDGI
jgi:hypothetical protein